ncbi:MAG: efflux transporter outer membrane subunit [Sumerlaeia bacterium]
MFSFHRNPISGFVFFACLMILEGCKTTTPQVPNPVVLPDEFLQTGEAVRSAKWWQDFQDPQLDALVEQALAKNFDLRSTWARLSQAEAQARLAGVSLFPTLDATGSFTKTYEKQEISTPRPNQTPKTVVDYSEDRRYNLGLSASYEVDLWGRLRSARNAALFEAQASITDLQSAAISLSATVASTFYRLQEQQGQIALLQKQAQTTQETLGLIEGRFRVGRSTASDVLQQRQLLESRQEEIRRAESQLRVLEISLATLVGEMPEGFDAGETGILIVLPPLPNTGIPAQWVQQRPDLAGALLAVQAADQRLASVIAEKYPRLSLTGSFSTADRRWRDLFDNWLSSLAANATVPILDGGRRKIEVQRNQAIVIERLNNYGQAVLNALAEVETALVQENEQRAIIASIQQQLALARQVRERIQAEFLQGNTEYLRVLDAQQTEQNLERELLSSQQQLIGFRIDLCRALAGGWEMPAPEAQGNFLEYLRGNSAYPLPLNPKPLTPQENPLQP